ncbi:EamA family transporter [Luteipulveratus flavus]|uniref:EamA family transporter n=1 Tax=Luteipulveratus flavus TaxID=3031728 RepID=A0ABT6C540_9MICO|nr:EamA family transporter [Luteipulveratus sp. YIM 133296]MDF8264064.1 EamA family transporter [Luteipulveratus sp. YIM 133296]
MTPRARPAVPAPTLVLVAIASVQLGGALAATLLPAIGVTGSVTLRILVAAVILLVVARPDLRSRSRHDWITVGSYAACLGLMNLAFYAALERLPIGVTVTIEFVGPLTLAAFTSRRRWDVLAVVAAAFGVVLVSGALDTSWSDLDLVGIALALLAGACWAGYIVTSARTGARFAGLDGIAIAMLLATVVIAPFGVVHAGTDLLDGAVLLKGAGIALLSSVVPYSLELVALRTLHANVFGILLSLEPAAAALAGLVVLGQSLTPLRLVGMALVVLASGVVLGTRRTTAAPEG